MNHIQKKLFAYSNWAPLSLTIREVSRLISFEKMLGDLKDKHKIKTILDVGCGDGKWLTQIDSLELSCVTGVDISEKEILSAKKFIKAYHADITSPDTVKLLNSKFDLIIGNCSMEHIFHIRDALINISTLLNDSGVFLLYVPTPTWAFKGKTLQSLAKISPRFSMTFSGALNGFFQHWHLYHYKIWIGLLNDCGFKVQTVKGLGNNRLDFFFRLFLPTSLLSFLLKAVTGKYANFYLSKLIPKSLFKSFFSLIEPHFDNILHEPEDPNTFEYIIVCEKK